MEQKHGQQQQTHHHILHNKTILAVGGALLFLTVVTVWVAGVDLGAMNFVVAMAVTALLIVAGAFFWPPSYTSEARLLVRAGRDAPMAKALMIPASIGQDRSHGCIRMRDHDLRTLYRLIARDAQVEIVP